MSYSIIDRRKNDKNKSLVNRKRFLDRVKGQIKDAMKDIIRNNNIDDILNNKKKKITIPGKGLDQPNFNYKSVGGVLDHILTGNDKFNTGDRILKPPGGSGQGNGPKGGNGEDGQDPFTFTLSRDEFMDLFFEDLELPDLVRKNLMEVEETIPKRSGFAIEGTPNRLNILRSLKLSKGRRFALKNPKKRKLKELEEELQELLLLENKSFIQEERIIEIEEEIVILKRKLKAIPFLDDVDLRYNRWENKPIPTTKAVVFSVMDVSGSMGEWEKEMAKRFYILLILFLKYNYEKITIVWIRHTTNAKVCTEEEFFNEKDNGGTQVSSALKLMKEVIDEKYSPSEYNIFACQISDGDNYSEDIPITMSLLEKEILPIVQYYIYVEVRKNTNGELWPYYKSLEKEKNNMINVSISDIKSIYPVFRKVFEKRIKNA